MNSNFGRLHGEGGVKKNQAGIFSRRILDGKYKKHKEAAFGLINAKFYKPSLVYLLIKNKMSHSLKAF